MKVIVNDDVSYRVGWRYTNTVLNAWLDVLGISYADARKMKGPELREKLAAIMKVANHKCIPTPDITECIIYDTDNKEVARAEVVRRDWNSSTSYRDLIRSHDGKEPHDPNKARIYSLTKVLKQTFPGHENKKLRKLFWEAYFKRGEKKVIQPVKSKEEVK